VKPDDSVNHREPEARAFADGLRREERLEDALPDIGANAAPGVGEAKTGIPTRRHRISG
jgi:hypothetical protein